MPKILVVTGFRDNSIQIPQTVKDVNNRSTILEAFKSFIRLKLGMVRYWEAKFAFRGKDMVRLRKAWNPILAKTAVEFYPKGNVRSTHLVNGGGLNSTRIMMF